MRRALAILLVFAAVAHAADLPEGPGLAAKYRGDAGIAKDQRVIFAEDFEGPDLSKWDDRDGNEPPKVRLVEERALVHAGRRSVQVEAAIGKEKGGDLMKLLGDGHELIHARWYCRFAEDFDQGNLMHFVSVAGLRNRWMLGQAGKKPDGTDFFITGLEPWRNWGRNPAPGAMGFYTYYVDMKPDRTGPYWGNEFRPKDPPVLVERGRWYCMEVRLKANHPDRADGEQTFWIDGKLKGHYTGLRWRTTDKLKINCLWMLLYIHDSPRVNRVWFDDIVVANEYIGPMQEK